MVQHSLGVLITWEMVIISFRCGSTRYNRTGVSRWIPSSMSSPYSTLSQELCSDRPSAFSIENSSGNGFDLLWAGPNAANVPKEAIIVDNSNPDIILSNASQWSSSNGVEYYRGSALTAIQAGASLSFSFDGVAIWYDCVSYTQNVHANLFFRYYGDVDRYNGFFSVSIDGSEPERLNGKIDGGQLTQQMLWSKTDLTPGRHIFTLRQDDITGPYTNLDFLRSVTIEVME